MSKSVRLADYLYEEVERLALTEKRSLANMVQVLLEQALKMDDLVIKKKLTFGEGAVEVPTTPRAERNVKNLRQEAADSHFRPDPKGGKS